jgi:hypothetical protein
MSLAVQIPTSSQFYAPACGELSVNARQKLNQIHVLGSMLAATVFGVASGSWTIFWIVAAALIAASFYSGDIRSPRGQQSGQSSAGPRSSNPVSKRDGQSRGRRN